MHGQQNIKLFLGVVCDFSTYVFGELVYIYIFIYYCSFNTTGMSHLKKRSFVSIQLLGYPERVFVVFVGLTMRLLLNSPRLLS